MTTPVLSRIIPAASQMTLKFNQSGQEAAVVLGLLSASTGPLSPADATAWRDAAWNAFRGLCHAGTTCTGAIVRHVGQADGQVIELGAPATNAAGTGAGAQAVAGATTLLKWSTATGGRTGKGRSYIPGLVASAVDATGRLYTADYQSGATAAAALYVGASFWSGDHEPAVLSFSRGAARGITSGACASVVGIQRRRMR